MDIKKQIALSIYEGVGGNPNQHFDTVDEIYAATDAIYKSQDYRQDVESLNITLDSNGTYIYDSRDVQGYKPVEINVNVDVDSYYNSGYENGVEEQKNKLESITIESNGTYIKEDGYNEVKVALDIPKTKIYNGFRFDGTGDNDYQYFKDIDFGLYDWSGVYDTAEFFSNIKSNDGGGLMASDFDNFIENFNGEMLSCYNMFKETAIKELPNFGELTKNCMRLEEMLRMSYIEDVSNLQYWNTSNVTDMTKTFYACNNLKSVPSFNTENVIKMKDTFEGCERLEEVGDLNTKNVVNMEQLFHKCESLIKTPELNTENVSNMRRMYCRCKSITYIPLLDCGSCTDITQIFSDSGVTLAKLTDLGGFKDLGKQSSLKGVESNGFLRNVPYLTHESLMNVINNLYDRKSAGHSTLSLMVGQLNLDKLSDSDISIAINKGWNIVS